MIQSVHACAVRTDTSQTMDNSQNGANPGNQSLPWSEELSKEVFWGFSFHAGHPFRGPAACGEQPIRL